MTIRLTTLASAGAILMGAGAPALGDSFDAYRQTRTFDNPGAMGVLSDGRLLAVDGSSVLEETAAGSGEFTARGTLPEDYDASNNAFLTVSPNRSRFAVGNNGGASFENFQVGVFDVDSLDGSVFDGVNHFDASWRDNDRLAITRGTFGSPSEVVQIAVDSDPTPSALIDNIQGASAGVAFDNQERLYTGNGFDSSPGSGSETGTIRAFASSDLDAGTPLDFETEGTAIADLLTASSLGFDNDGNLFVGGGEFGDGENDFFALIDNVAIDDALAGAGAIDSDNPDQILRFDPAPADGSRYTLTFNPVTNELYASSGGTVYAYAVPEPAGLAMFTVGAGLLALRRRGRRA